MMIYHAVIDVDVTQLPRQTRLAKASKLVDSVDASRARHTRHRLTLIYIDVAILSRVTQRTVTLVIINQIDASRVVMARHRETLVEIQIAPFARITRHTITLKAPFLVDTDAVAANRTAWTFALVYVILAEPASVTGRADAIRRVIFGVHNASGAVSARVFRARVDVYAAIFAYETRRTPTLVLVDQIEADFALRARNSYAVVDVLFAPVAFETYEILMQRVDTLVRDPISTNLRGNCTNSHVC